MPIVCPNQDDICFLIMLESHFTKYLNHENYTITRVDYDDDDQMVLFIGTNISSGDFSFVGSLLVDD
jgi:hypothetical protein